MKLADRLKFARECEAIARGTGAQVTINPRGVLGNGRATSVHAHWPTVSASFSIDGVLRGVDPRILVSFYGAARDLSGTYPGFNAVNAYHRRKATALVSPEPVAFLAWWRRTCADVAAGRIFAEN